MKRRTSERLILFTGVLCLVGLLFRTFLPEVILPRPEVWMYVGITGFSRWFEPRIETWEEAVFDWMLGTVALSFFPALAGLSIQPLWMEALVSGVFSGLTMLAMDGISRRQVPGESGGVLALNVGILMLAVQGFNHVFL